MPTHQHQELIEHICRHSTLDSPDAERLVSEVLAHFQETTDAFVRRRHRELQHQGKPNSAIFDTILHELPNRVFPAAPISERQIRRIIYG